MLAARPGGMREMLESVYVGTNGQNLRMSAKTGLKERRRKGRECHRSELEKRSAVVCGLKDGKMRRHLK